MNYYKSPHMLSDTGSVRLHPGPNTIPPLPSVRDLFLSRGSADCGPWRFWPSYCFFLVVSCSGLLGKEGVVKLQGTVLLNVKLSSEGCSSLGYSINCRGEKIFVWVFTFIAANSSLCGTAVTALLLSREEQLYCTSLADKVCFWAIR